ncbi:NAD-dependent protein deacylase Sirt4 isoform X2 [Euwallacea fornicatus]|uniref:NAD-dependent protein deacylase Sirt4 isoform X2 n=1 Tax=Euwallacea fornicatus TaxID=995702 RepID=UPI00338E498F
MISCAKNCHFLMLLGLNTVARKMTYALPQLLMNFFHKSSCIPSKLFINQFVPKHKPPSQKDVNALEEFILNSKKLMVLTGAGVSTESGIPDYRSAEVGMYARTNHKPIQNSDFHKYATVRQRYWARNFVGWFRFSKMQPNLVHFYLSDLESRGKVHSLVTQNVDGLHLKAGSRNVIELHGTGYRVLCLDCNASYDRDYIQDTLMDNNIIDFEQTSRMIRPDGDVDIPQEFIMNFSVPTCECCGGILKPDITFFGDNIPKHRVELIRTIVSSSDCILVLGSSLSVFSGCIEEHFQGVVATNIHM